MQLLAKGERLMKKKYKVLANAFCPMADTTAIGGEIVELTDDEYLERHYLVEPVETKASKDSTK
jgi:hypothetical protein